MEKKGWYNITTLHSVYWERALQQNVLKNIWQKNYMKLCNLFFFNISFKLQDIKNEYLMKTLMGNLDNAYFCLRWYIIVYSYGYEFIFIWLYDLVLKKEHGLSQWLDSKHSCLNVLIIWIFNRQALFL